MKYLARTFAMCVALSASRADSQTSTRAAFPLRWLTVTNKELEVDGLPWFKENQSSLSRLPARLKGTFRPPVWSLAQSPSGGRIRFRSDTKALALRLEYPSAPNMANMQAYGQTGVDLYLDGNFVVNTVADADARNGKLYERVLFDFLDQPRVEREITLYLPLYKPVHVKGVGVDEGAVIKPARPFALSKPVVFYGTSITQGGCASRPGMSYTAIVGRKLNLDFVNLGFSGNGLGEPEVARAVNEIDAACYVLDFGANHKTNEEMKRAYGPLLEAVRAAHPKTPIVVMTPLYTSREERVPSLKLDWHQRREHIAGLVRRRIEGGDTNLLLVDGATLMGPAPGEGLVDGQHPNDLGFYWIAEGLVPFLRQALRLPVSEVIASPADLKARIPAQLRITKPDYVVFVPAVTDAEVNDTGNEHFLVFDGPKKSLMAVWTQSSAEAQPDQHISFSQSADEGKTWSKPRIIAGPKTPGEGNIASWGYPLVSRTGRVYVLYSQHIGRFDTFFHHTGWLHGIYSDDGGLAWSKPQNIPVARSSNDNPDTSVPPNMLCWQKPLRLGKDGRYFAGFTRWTSFAVRKPATKSWISADSHVEFMRFENVDDNPEPRDLKISWFASNGKALAVPFPGHPAVSVCQEPTVVKLPDGRLFCVMRTAAGSPYWSVSADLGETWAQPRRLLRKDGGQPVLQPLSPCPMYDVGGNEAGSGRYALFIHNHDGHYKNYNPTDTGYNRRPIYLVPGRFKAGADQPIWFDEPRLFMDHDGVSLGKPGTKGRLDLALYSSFTARDGRPVLWYPDRKFFLLGKNLSDELPADLRAPEIK